MISSQLAILEQATTYLRSTNSLEYTQILLPLFISSAGSHMRHILDHYQAVITGLDTHLIDYDKRSRGGETEKKTAAALIEIEKIKAFLLSLSPDQLQMNLQLSTAISVTDKKVAIITTTLERELVFVASHTVHHFAMIAQISKAQHKEVPAEFGIAPATASFLRGEKCAP